MNRTIQTEDLLLRPYAKIDYRSLREFITGKSIIVTGGGGSIGSQLCERLVDYGVGKLLIIENSEPALYKILTKLKDTGVQGRLACIRDRERIFQLFQEFRPDIVYHAAALKHVPYLELDWGEAIKTNVHGSINIADASVQFKSMMVMISTDKAVEPKSVLGATKKLAEEYCKVLDATNENRLISVRFGNVLESSGSVVPLFKSQIERGGPVTVTDHRITRYFMDIREACDLTITASSYANASKASTTYVLNMGLPIRIKDLAERMIKLSGKNIEIVYTGMRPGERLEEILFEEDETVSNTRHGSIMEAST